MTERRLNTAQDVRRYLANLINRTEQEKIEPGLAKTLTYMTSILIRALEGSDLESRIETLEKQILPGK